MLDMDLALLYGVETKVLNQAVKRNIDRFPDSFRFQLTEAEYTHCSRSQIVTLNNEINNNKLPTPQADGVLIVPFLNVRMRFAVNGGEFTQKRLKDETNSYTHTCSPYIKLQYS